jgi:restriction system protein
MSLFDQPIYPSPEAFEKAVKSILDAAGAGLVSYSSSHLESVAGSDGQYEIDVTARFEALGASFLVLVECKHHKRKVERQDVQALYAKVQSTGAQKGMLFSSAGFQSGAIEYADIHGIALIQLADGNTSWFTRSATPLNTRPDWAGTFEYCGWWQRGNRFSIMSEDENRFTRMALGIDSPDA